MHNRNGALIAAVAAGIFSGIYLNVAGLQLFGGADDVHPWALGIMAGVLGGGIYHFVERLLHQLVLVALALLLAWFFSGVLGTVALAFAIAGLGAFVVSLLAGRKF